MKFLARLHRRRMAAKHWDAEKARLLAFRTPLNMRLLEVMHLRHTRKPTGEWS